jgi:hypothetical protein
VLRDKSRPSRIPPLTAEVEDKVVRRTLGAPDGELPTGRPGHGQSRRPHRIRQFKLSNDPNFAAKLRAVAGLYVNAPEHAVACGSTKRARSRHSTARNWACR